MYSHSNGPRSSLNVIDSFFVSNTAASSNVLSNEGGGILVSVCTFLIINLTNSTFTSNEGGCGGALSIEFSRGTVKVSMMCQQSRLVVVVGGIR